MTAAAQGTRCGKDKVRTVSKLLVKKKKIPFSPLDHPQTSSGVISYN